jgi:hypothetical protein
MSAPLLKEENAFGIDLRYEGKFSEAAIDKCRVSPFGGCGRWEYSR